jgi:hypothetical protein
MLIRNYLVCAESLKHRSSIKKQKRELFFLFFIRTNPHLKLAAELGLSMEFGQISTLQAYTIQAAIKILNYCPKAIIDGFVRRDILIKY